MYSTFMTSSVAMICAVHKHTNTAEELVHMVNFKWELRGDGKNVTGETVHIEQGGDVWCNSGCNQAKVSEKASSVPPRETVRGSVSNAARWVILMAARCPNSKKILQIMWNGRLMPIIPLYLEVTVPRTGNQNLAKTRLKKHFLPRLIVLFTV